MSVVTSQAIKELQNASDYLAIRKNLRWPAIGSVVFGLIAIVVGLISIEENPINVVLVLIGVFLLTEGIWLIVKPSPRGMIVDEIALLILGIWNVFITLLNFAAGYYKGIILRLYN